MESMKKHGNGELHHQQIDDDHSLVQGTTTATIARKGGSSGAIATLILLLRVFGLLFCVAAIFLIVTDKQSKTIQFSGLSGFALTKTAKFTSSTAFIYLLVATALGGAYAFIYVIIFITHRRGMGNTPSPWLVFVVDQVLTYILLGAVAASTEIAYLGKHGFEAAGWIEICTYFDRFCNQMGVALAMAYLATLCSGVSASLSAFKLFSRC